MTIDLDTLEALAKAATPGPWDNGGDRVFYDAEPSGIEADIAFIAAANPATVLELIAELRTEREKYTNAVKAYKAAVQEGEWLASQVHKQRRRCPPLQECNGDDIVTENDCQQCWLNAAREAVEEEGKE